MHTPGPWKIIKEKNEKVCWIANENAESIGDGFATVWSAGYENARLIAAAPELIDALQNIVSAFSGTGQLTMDFWDGIHKAKSVIAKATGEQ